MYYTPGLITKLLRENSGFLPFLLYSRALLIADFSPTFWLPLYIITFIFQNDVLIHSFSFRTNAGDFI
jgi:hypothetical protein